MSLLPQLSSYTGMLLVGLFIPILLKRKKLLALEYKQVGVVEGAIAEEEAVDQVIISPEFSSIYAPFLLNNSLLSLIFGSFLHAAQ
jgi:hypothetical protein